MNADLAYDDRRGLLKGLPADGFQKIGGITGLMRMDLELCRIDSEVIGRDKTLRAILDGLSDDVEKRWLAAWLSPECRQDRIEQMEECVTAEAWHDLSCALSGWHDDFITIGLLYGRWDADAPRRNARKKRKKTQEPGASWQRELARHLRAEGPQTHLAKYRHIPGEHEEPLSLCDGQFWITRRKGEGRGGRAADLIRCAFEDGRAPVEITRSTFERYLKESPVR